MTENMNGRQKHFLHFDNFFGRLRSKQKRKVKSYFFD